MSFKDCLCKRAATLVFAALAIAFLASDVLAETYVGNLRLYMVEPLSRYRDKEGSSYHYGLLGYAYNGYISVPDNSVYSNTVTWSWPDITTDNIMVIAVVFEDDGHTNYSDPPSGYPFTAHYGEATAAATPGVSGFNKVIPGSYSHTVFLEEATAGW